MYKSISAVLFLAFMVSSIHAQSNRKLANIELTVQKINNQFVIVNYHFTDNSKLTIQGFENDSSLNRLEIENGAKIIGLFQPKSFASAGGLGSTRVAKGTYRIIEIISGKENPTRGSSKNKRSVPLSLIIGGSKR